jgi:hypothetical protein
MQNKYVPFWNFFSVDCANLLQIFNKTTKNVRKIEKNFVRGFFLYF